MRWPVLRFEEFFERHRLRRAREQLDRERDMMVTAINANSFWDETKEAREAKVERVGNIQQSWKRGVEILYSKITGVELPKEPDPMEDDPLFRPLGKQASDLATTVGRPVADEEGAGAALMG